MGNNVDTVEEKIQNAILTTIVIVSTPTAEIAFRLRNASSGRDATNVTSNSERAECMRITASSENVSERNNTFRVLKTNVEARNIVPDEVREVTNSGINFDQQPHTHPCGDNSKY